jgi:hypothetical protein
MTSRGFANGMTVGVFIALIVFIAMAINTACLSGSRLGPDTITCTESSAPAQPGERVTTIEGRRYVCGKAE